MLLPIRTLHEHKDHPEARKNATKALAQRIVQVTCKHQHTRTPQKYRQHHTGCHERQRAAVGTHMHSSADLHNLPSTHGKPAGTGDSPGHMQKISCHGQQAVHAEHTPAQSKRTGRTRPQPRKHAPLPAPATQRLCQASCNPKSHCQAATSNHIGESRQGHRRQHITPQLANTRCCREQE